MTFSRIRHLATPSGMLLVLVVSGVHTATAQLCPGSLEVPIRITADSIGPLPKLASVRELREICPTAKDTMAYGFESGHPAVRFLFSSLVVVAYQWGEELNEDNVPRAWVISGCGGRLPRGVTTCATWRELTAAYGTQGMANAEFGPVRVSLTGLPHAQFRLDVTDRDVGPIEVHNDLTRIPATGRVVQVSISR